MSSSISGAPPPNSATAIITRTVTICSGVDKIGKSTTCINLAIALASTGKRVCILDTDPGISSIHRTLGISPHYSLADVVRQECNIRDAISHGPGGISLLFDGGYLNALKKMQAPQRLLLIHQLQSWYQNLDFVLIDSAAAENELDQWIAMADSLLIVLAPESRVLSETSSLLSHLSPPCLKKPMHVVVNRSVEASQAERTFHKFGSTTQKFLDTEVHYCGFIASDDNIRNSVSLQYPVALYDRDDPSCAGFFKLAGVLDTQWAAYHNRGAGLAAALGEDLQKILAEPQQPQVTPASISDNPDKAQLMQAPTLADQLIERDLIGPQELRQVIDALVATGRKAFPAAFSEGVESLDTPAVDAAGEQRSLLNQLRQSGDAGQSLDQLLRDFVKGKQA